MSKMYSHDLLKSNFDEDVNNYVNMFQNIKLNEYFSLFNNQSISNYKKRCISEASIIINNNYLTGDNNTYFGIGCSDKLFMTISIAGDLFRNQKIDEVREQLENIGYEVITEGVTQFNIILNNKYLDMTLSETYTELENIKKDYLTIYNDVLGTKLK